MDERICLGLTSNKEGTRTISRHVTTPTIPITNPRASLEWNCSFMFQFYSETGSYSEVIKMIQCELVSLTPRKIPPVMTTES